MKNTTSREYNPMEHLAEHLGLTFDGGEDTRLFLDESHAETLKLSKAEYKAMEKRLRKSYKGKGFEVYAWNDCSGYNYWTKKQQEDNYIMITADITDPLNLDIEALKIALRQIDCDFLQYRNGHYEGFQY